MKSGLCIILAFLLLCIPARAAEPPLALSAYVRGDDLIITVFTTAPVTVVIQVFAPKGWTVAGDGPDWTPTSYGATWSGASPGVLQQTLRTSPGRGLGTFVVRVYDSRGLVVTGRAYAAGHTTTAADPVGIRRRYLALVRR